MKRVSDETLWLRYKAPEPDLDKLFTTLRGNINKHINLEANSEREIRKFFDFPSTYGRKEL